MADEDRRRERAVPSGRLARLGQFGRLAGSVAGGMMAEGARRIADGERPQMRDMILTPGNIRKTAERLSHLRGAAMKLGQMISMDAGDVLPPELAELMAVLRADAHHMPPAQLDKVLKREWGTDWRRQFTRFDARPVAAASIGQVHRALTRDGRDLAIKVQYPGVRESIDADVDNVATMLRIARLLPPELDVAPLLAAAKEQLAQEADYLREGECMTRFGALLAEEKDLIVPMLDEALTTKNVLAMSYIESRPIETLSDAPPEQRDEVMRTLMALVLREMFEFGLMQTDPNFANYRFQPDTGRLVLLDFGATRPVAQSTAQGYRRLLAAGLEADRDAVREAAVGAGFVAPEAVLRHRERIDRMIDIVQRRFDTPGPVDFSDRTFVAALREDGTAIAADRAAWHIPPTDVMFVQRKVSGTALLAARLKARVDVRSLAQSWVGE